MRSIVRGAALASLLLLQGCWFVYIPPGMMNAIGDSLTGAEGEHCVSANAKVGDIITTPTFKGRVKSLSGTSSRCQGVYPIRAKLEAI